jgi:glucokinase
LKPDAKAGRVLAPVQSVEAAAGSEEEWLLADIGGTNVRFALAGPAASEPLREDSVQAFRVAGFESLAAAARVYLQGRQGRAGHRRPSRAVFALAGRVEGGQGRLTNHPWRIDAAQLQADLGLRSVRLINDFAAVGLSLPLLGESDVQAVGPPVAPIDRALRATYCVLGPGTGLGVSALAIDSGTVLSLQTEGGHAGFAPTTEEEIDLLRRLAARFGRVSMERLLCGSGLANLHEALCAMHGGGEAPLAPETITERALQRSDPRCTRAVELFCEILGSFAGDCALIFGAWQGVYLAGGMLEALSPWIRTGPFRTRFESKGRFAEAMARVPVALITHPQPGLLGAAACAVLDSSNPPARTPTAGGP